MKKVPNFTLRVILCLVFFILLGCNKSTNEPLKQPIDPIPPISYFTLKKTSLNSIVFTTNTLRLRNNHIDAIRFSFSDKIDRNSVSNAFSWSAVNPNILFSYENNDSTLLIKPGSDLSYLSKYNFGLSKGLKSISGINLFTSFTLNVITGIDPSLKFPKISDEALLDSVQKASFNYYLEHASTTSGLLGDVSSEAPDARTTFGGTGFALMTFPGAVNRGFITRSQALFKVQQMVSFVNSKVSVYKGVFPAWVNGITGKSQYWNGLDGWDVPNTAFFIMGMLTVRQYFDGTSAEETKLREDITSLYNKIEWPWYHNSQNFIYWSYNPTAGWILPVRGWVETLVMYVLAAGSPTHPIDKSVYEIGWTRNGNFVNGKQFYGYTLPLGQDYGGQAYLNQFSFLGINPNGLTDQYADYGIQAKNASLIGYEYCKAQHTEYPFYCDSVWGITAGASANGYIQESPSNDQGYIYPSASLASFPYSPVESMKAMKYFYYKLGNLIWTKYGFTDSFSFSVEPYWVSNEVFSYDQMNTIVGIENYRSGLPWKLFTSCPEVQTGLKQLGFTAPYIK